MLNNIEIPNTAKLSKLEKEILKNTKTIAFIGLSDNAEKLSNKVAKYLIEYGYKIIPVYPKGNIILGEKVYRSLNQIDKNFETVVIFVNSKIAKNIVYEAIKLNVRYIWLQEDVFFEDEKIKQKLNNFVENKCFYKTRKLLN